jgi:3-phenylpropionate/trans-cinnamate dioxygenase ferredoxin reductase subunit
MIVIAGGGLAAQRFTERIRREGWDGPIRIVCDEPVAPYDRPPLSKEFLAEHGAEPPLFRAADWYADNDVELLFGDRAVALHPQTNELELRSGTRLPYDRLLIATGAEPRRIPAARDAHYLRSLADAERLRSALRPGVRLAVVGAGFIGQEVAATARKLGAEVTLIEALPAPLMHILGRRVGDWFTGLHREEGVDVRLGAAVESFTPGRLTLADGGTVEYDELLVGIGVRPATAWVAGSGLDPAGIQADAAGCTAIPDVFAAGDCTVGCEHWEAAAHQAAGAAQAMLGKSPRPAPLAGFWSDLYGLRLNWLGDATAADDVTIEGNTAERDFAATWTSNGKPVAGLLVNRPRGVPELRKLMTEGVMA